MWTVTVVGGLKSSRRERVATGIAKRFPLVLIDSFWVRNSLGDHVQHSNVLKWKIKCPYILPSSSPSLFHGTSINEESKWSAEREAASLRLLMMSKDGKGTSDK